MGFSWPFRVPTKTKLAGFRVFFVDVGAPPAIENMRKQTALESSEENVFLSQVPPPQPGSHARGQ